MKATFGNVLNDDEVTTLISASGCFKYFVRRIFFQRSMSGKEDKNTCVAYSKCELCGFIITQFDTIEHLKHLYNCHRHYWVRVMLLSEKEGETPLCNGDDAGTHDCFYKNVEFNEQENLMLSDISIKVRNDEDVEAKKLVVQLRTEQGGLFGDNTLYDMLLHRLGILYK